MDAQKKSLGLFIEHAIPWLVLAILLTYSVAKFSMHPYGFRWRSNGTVHYLLVHPLPPTLLPDDQLVQVGPVRWDDFNADLRKTFFERVRPGDIVPIKVERNGQILTIPWTYPGFNLGDFYDQLPSEWIIAYFFWTVGLLTVVLVRPKDTRWWLLASFDFLTAIWLMAGSGNSAFHTWYSALVLRITIWLCIPVYLHLHWIFPRPLGKLPRLTLPIFYAVFLIIAIAQALQLFSSSLYYLGFLTAVTGSLILLILHSIRQKESRHDLALLTILIFLALTPSIAIGIATMISSDYPIAINLGLIGLPLIPLAYLYAAYRRLLGEMEVRVNRLISAYLFLILLGSIGIPLLASLDRLLPSPRDALIVEAMAALFAAVISIWGFPAFQSYVEHHWLGIWLPTKRLPEIYSARISTSNSFAALEKLLKDEVLPSLLVKQFVFLQMGRPPKLIFAVGVGQEQIQEIQSAEEVISPPGKYRPLIASDVTQPNAWVRLVLPLRVGEELIGIWLLGRRDPDDFYSHAEIILIESLANQTAIAMSNILQSEQLRAIYQADANRHEQERINLARDLHDSILNQLAALLMNLDPANITPNFQKAYDQLTHRLREIVSDLRPPMLNYGLKPAIVELADNLMQRRRDEVKIAVDLQSNDVRYAGLTELHLFRIIQEACENALRHGQARNIQVGGRLDAEHIDIRLEDDGVGFESGDGFELSNLIANKHFGLLGMAERAELIGAEIHIDSAPQAGTHIQITWKPSPA